jgi:hypothetical protein
MQTSVSARWALPVGRWNRLELQVVMNSKPGSADGTVRVWLNGAPVDSLLNVPFDAASDPATTRWNWLTAGHQREGAAGDADISEVRYWDNLVWATQRQP